MGKNLVLLVAMIALSILLVEGVGMAMATLPDHQQLDPETTALLTDGGQAAVLVDSTVYELKSGGFQRGCYKLTAPGAPGGRGTAELAWPMCRKVRK